MRAIEIVDRIDNPDIGSREYLLPFGRVYCRISMSELLAQLFWIIHSSSISRFGPVVSLLPMMIRVISCDTRKTRD